MAGKCELTHAAPPSPTHCYYKQLGQVENIYKSDGANYKTEADN